MDNKIAGSGIPMTGGETPIETNPESKFCIEKNIPLPDSKMWNMLTRYYDKMAIEAWTQNYVPSFVTSNSRLARSYARIILGFLRDHFNRPGSDKGTPVYILELGAGHGRFTYLVVKSLLRWRDQFEHLGLPAKPFVYVFTDVAEANIDFCSKHPRFEGMVKEGWLDFAFVDGNISPLVVELRKAGGLVPEGASIVAVANYVLDSLLTDAFRICKGKLYRTLVSLYSPQIEPDLTCPDIMTRMSARWEWDEVEIESGGLKSVPPIKYMGGDTSSIVEVLQNYLSLGVDLSFVLPIGAMKLLATISRFSRGDFLFIIGDKGYPSHEEFFGHKDPHIAIHGSISFMVNLHALRVFSECMGGEGRCTPWRDTFQLMGLWGCPEKKNDEKCKKNDGKNNQKCEKNDEKNHEKCEKNDEKNHEKCEKNHEKNHEKCEQNRKSIINAVYPASLVAFSDDLQDMPPDSLISWQRDLVMRLNIQNGEHQTADGSAEMLKNLMCLLRYSGHDADVFWTFRTQFAKWSCPPFTSSRTEDDLVKDIAEVYSNWYKLRDGEDLPDVCGHICMRLGRCDSAVVYFNESIRHCPEVLHAATYINLSSCYKVLGRLDLAMDACNKAIEMAPNYVHAKELKANLLMCKNPLQVAILGCSPWTRYQGVQLLLRDKRVECVGAVCFSSEEKDWFEKVFIPLFGKSPQFHLYENEAGLDQLLHINNAQAFVIDLSAQSHAAEILPKLWAQGKHTLTKSPLSFSPQEIIALTHEYAKYEQLIAWHSVNHISEDAYVEAQSLLGQMGALQSFTVSIVRDAGRNPLYPQDTSPYCEREFLCMELLNALCACQFICGRQLAELSVEHVKNSEHDKNNESNKNSNQNNTNNNEKNNNNNIINEETNPPAKEISSLCGWVKFTDGVAGSLMVFRQSAENRAVLSFRTETGSLIMTNAAANWQLTVLNREGGRRETGVACIGQQNNHEVWLEEVLWKSRGILDQNVEKTLKNEEKTLKNEEKTLKNEEKTLKNEKKTLKNEKKTLKNEEQTLKNQEKTLKNENSCGEECVTIEEEIRKKEREEAKKAKFFSHMCLDAATIHGLLTSTQKGGTLVTFATKAASLAQKNPPPSQTLLRANKKTTA